MTPIWYVAKFLQPHATFSQGEKVAVRQVAHDFEVCSLSGLHLTRLTVDEAVRLLRSEKDERGYLVRVEAPGVLEMRLARNKQPRDNGELMHMAVTGEERPVLGLGRIRATRQIVGWRCFVIGCDQEVMAECGREFTWKDQPEKCPKCGSPLFEAIYA